MTRLDSSSTDELDRILTRLFDDEGLHNLCFGLGVDYDSLRGEDQVAKARELVALAKRQGRLAELESAVRRERLTTYSRERVQELQASILAASQPNVRDAFIEFVQQIEAYLDEFNLLREHVEEWAKVRNLLQDLQISFAPCRSHIFALSRLAGPTRSTRSQQERILFEVEVEWRPCKRTLRELQELAASLQAIEEPYDPKSDCGPDWFCIPWRIKTEIDQALFDDDAVALAEHLSAFGDQVDRSLYLADKALCDVIGKISRLPCPASYAVR